MSDLTDDHQEAEAERRDREHDERLELERYAPAPRTGREPRQQCGLCGSFLQDPVPGYRWRVCPKCGAESEVTWPRTAGQRADDREADMQAARDGYNPNG